MKAKAPHSEFTPIDDEKTVSRYLRYMQDLNCHVHCAVRETDIRFETTPLRVLDDKIVHLRMKGELMSATSLRDRVLATEAQRVDISYHAHDILIFASTKLNKIDKDGISLEVERPIYKLQRREHLRVKPAPGLRCNISMLLPHDNKVHEYPPYDISVSGFSILVSMDEAKVFEVDQEVKDIGFLFGAHELRINASVRSKVPIKGPRKTNIKIGFRSSSIPSALEHEISRYAYLISQKILGRRI